jgi:WD40 repeat protein
MKILLLIPFLFILSSGAGQQPELITQEKNLGIITHITYSPNGRYIASANEKDYLIKVWDVQSTKLIGTLIGHHQAIHTLTFNPTGDLLFSQDIGNHHYIWDVNVWKMKDSLTGAANGKLILSSDFNTYYYTTPTELFSATASTKTSTLVLQKLKFPLQHFGVGRQTILAQNTNKELQLFDLTSGKEISKINTSNAKTKVREILFQHQVYYIAYENGEVERLDETGKLLNTISTGIGHYQAMTLANKSKKMAVAKGGKLLMEFDCEHGNLINEIPLQGDHETIKTISYSPDETTVAIAGYRKLLFGRTISHNNVIEIINIPHKKLIKTLKGDVNPIDGFTFSPKENVLFVLRGQALDIWNLNNGERLTKFMLHPRKIEVAERAGYVAHQKTDAAKESVATDVKNLNTSKIKTARDLASGDFSAVKNKAVSSKGTVINETKQLGKAAFMRAGFQEDKIVVSKNENYLITALKEDEIRLYKMEQYVPVHQGFIQTGQKEFYDILIDPTEKFVVIGGSGKSPISIVELSDVKKHRKLELNEYNDPKMGSMFQNANAMSFSPDGSRLLVAFNTGRIVIWETNYWQKLGDFKCGIAMATKPYVGFNSEGNKFFVNTALGIITYDFSAYQKAMKDGELAEGQTLGIEKAKVNGHPVMSHKPLDYLVAIDHDHLNFLEVLKNKTVATAPFNTKLITDIQVNKFGYTGVSLKNGELRVYDPTTGIERFIMVGEEDNAIFKTPENYYKVTREGQDLVIFRIGKDAYPFEQFDTKYNRPDIVLTAMNSEDESIKKLYRNAYEKRLAKLGIRESDLDNTFRAPTIDVTNISEIPLVIASTQLTLNISAQEKNSTLKKLQVWINDVPLYGAKGKSISGKDYSSSVQIDLVTGSNKIQVAVENSGGVESLRYTLEVENTTPTTPNLYVLTIGTSLYKDKRYNLNYAAKDAQDLAKLLANNSKGLYGKVNVKTITNQEANRITIEGLKSFFNSATIHDVVLVFVAGHGLLDANYDYFYGTHDIDFLKPQVKGLPYNSLEQLLDGIKPIKKMLIMDTCHSGEVEEDDLVAAQDDEASTEDDDVLFRAVGPKLSTVTDMSPSKMMRELFIDLRKGTGTTVITSAGGAEFAMESNEWKNGLFTFCLLSGLRNYSADLNQDGKIMLSELQLYTTDRVTQLSKGKQTPTTRIQNLSMDYQVW